MRKGEKGILFGIGFILLSIFGWQWVKYDSELIEEDKGIPFYTDASAEVKEVGYALYKKYVCKECHTLWTIRTYMQSVPAPAMDGIGSLRSEEWLFQYLSTESPQEILPTRLKKEYQMPSYAHLPEEERKVLASYLASLKVEDWYLEQTKKAEYEKLTGKPYP